MDVRATLKFLKLTTVIILIGSTIKPILEVDLMKCDLTKQYNNANMISLKKQKFIFFFKLTNEHNETSFLQSLKMALKSV